MDQIVLTTPPSKPQPDGQAGVTVEFPRKWEALNAAAVMSDGAAQTEGGEEM